jgi:hypothetical protein
MTLSTDSRHPLRLLLEIEEAIRVDAKRRPWDLRVRRDTSYILRQSIEFGFSGTGRSPPEVTCWRPIRRFST